MKKKWIILLYGIVIAAALAMTAYEYFAKGAFNEKSLISMGVIVLSAILGIIRVSSSKRKPGIVNKTAVYSKAYEKQIGNAFATMPKERKVFFKSLDDLNQGKHQATVKKLLKLDEECRGVAEQRAISFFLGRNYEKLWEFEKAIQQYERCLSMGGDAKAANNLATCFAMTDRQEDYHKALHMAVTLGYNGRELKEFIRSLDPPFEV